MPENNKEFITAQSTADFIARYNTSTNNLINEFSQYSPQVVDEQFAIFYADMGDAANIEVGNYVYASIPKLFGLMDDSAVVDVGATSVQTQMGLNLTGSGVIVGFVDTGIDYTNPLFRLSTGQTRIVGIWDQTDNEGNTPEGLDYGSEYTMQDINRALEDQEPLRIVPQTDDNGHGTFMASLACGREDTENQFVGAAPGAQIAMVKLKPAKQYLRDYYLIEGDTEAYQENDIMLGITYLRSLGRKYNKPVVYVLGLGSANGARVGATPLGEVMDVAGERIGGCSVLCAGNEADSRLHYSGRLVNGESEDVEIRVGGGTKGFVLELWGKAPDIFSVEIVSPLGDSTERIQARKGIVVKRDFLIEQTRAEVTFELVEAVSGRQLIFIRFVNPAEGVWTIRIFGSNILWGDFNIWGPLKQFTNGELFFLKPNPEMTLTEPSGSTNILTVGGYDNQNNVFYPSSGRGPNGDKNPKPDVVAPSLNVEGAGIKGQQFLRRSGTSVGAAICAGCCAQMLEWGAVNGNEPYMKTNYIKNYFIRGAVRDRNIQYPSNQWGYGKLNVYNSFFILISD